MSTFDVGHVFSVDHLAVDRVVQKTVGSAGAPTGTAAESSSTATALPAVCHFALVPFAFFMHFRHFNVSSNYDTRKRRNQTFNHIS